MPVAQNGWSTPVEADLYFADERSITSLWDALADDDAKNRVLNAAYNRIYYHTDFTGIPEAGTETAAQLVILIKAQSELSYYLLMHLEDEDRRKGLQIQAVAGAGIVKETYTRFNSDTITPGDLPLPPIVVAMLDGFKDLPTMAMIDIDRNEDEGVQYDAVDDPSL